MAEHCTQLGLPAREDYIFVAKALSQVSQVREIFQMKATTKNEVERYKFLNLPIVVY